MFHNLVYAQVIIFFSDLFFKFNIFSFNELNEQVFCFIWIIPLKVYCFLFGSE